MEAQRNTSLLGHIFDEENSDELRLLNYAPEESDDSSDDESVTSYLSSCGTSSTESDIALKDSDLDIEYLEANNQLKGMSQSLSCL